MDEVKLREIKVECIVKLTAARAPPLGLMTTVFVTIGKYRFELTAPITLLMLVKFATKEGIEVFVFTLPLVFEFKFILIA